MDLKKTPTIVPTWRGRVETTRDALLIFEACFNGNLPFCPRRVQTHERNGLIVSGNVFVCDEASSSIQRWRDGLSWSPSRILTNFLIYRQLDEPFSWSRKRRAQKSIKETARKEGENRSQTVSRSLVGSLVDSYDFKDDGLLKKTMTVIVDTLPYHLIAYYSVNDATYYLKTPRVDCSLKDLRIQDALLYQSRFISSDLDDTGDENFDRTEGSPYLHSIYRWTGCDRSRIHVAPPHNLHQAQLFRSFSRQDVHAPAQPPAAGTSSAGVYPPTTAACDPQQQPDICVWEYQDQQNSRRFGHQLPQHQDQQPECADPPQWYAMPQYTGPFAIQPWRMGLQTAPDTPGGYDSTPHWAPLIEAVAATGGLAAPQPQLSHTPPTRSDGPSWASRLEASAGYLVYRQ